jgi:MFS-type transporter involved in bile tolerance (Atg22 family)
MATVGRGIAGMVHYRRPIPKERKYAIALAVYIATSLIECFLLYFPVPVMGVLMFASGVMGITSYTIRVSATQKYVPDERKGRFNGAFNMLNTVGSLTGEITAGALTNVIPTRVTVMLYGLICALAAVIFIGGNKSEVSRIYNTEE